MLRRRALVQGGLVVASVGLAGCGFRLRQPLQFAFQRLLAQLPDSSPLRRELRLALQAAGVQVMATMPAPQIGPDGLPRPPAEPMPDASLEILADQREKAVVGTTAAGQVREFQLRVRLRFRLITPQGKELIPDAELLVQRDISYSESVALSKADEEAEMYRDMQSDVVQQALRRLAAVRTL